MRDQLTHVLGDGREWEYSGECVDLRSPTGECDCGHQGLRYLFTIHHPDGRSATVGSTCVLQFDEANLAMAWAIEKDATRLRREAREAANRAKRAAEAEARRQYRAELGDAIEAPLGELSQIAWDLEKYLATDRGLWIPHHLWAVGFRRGGHSGDPSVQHPIADLRTRAFAACQMPLGKAVVIIRQDILSIGRFIDEIKQGSARKLRGYS